MLKRRKFYILKLTFKSINDKNVPQYTKLSLLAELAYNFRFSEALVIKIPKEYGALQVTAATIFTIFLPMLEILKTIEFLVHL